ncbi:expressed unknown protein [Seminavis robusta]|uniref:Uncharacterized protein n=1 Tax=Seminavis robusta TaxID=568900 RepID=A0A9N8DNE8_9STRA|nr:expressed unknown protein [Seminavis robusta]|eukprot:Sro258_g101101.1  (121) ;mRNA; f:37091-37453
MAWKILQPSKRSGPYELLTGALLVSTQKHSTTKRGACVESSPAPLLSLMRLHPHWIKAFSTDSFANKDDDHRAVEMLETLHGPIPIIVCMPAAAFGQPTNHSSNQRNEERDGAHSEMLLE